MIHAFCRSSKRVNTLDVLSGLVLLGLLIAQSFGPLVSLQPGHLLSLSFHQVQLPAQFMVQLLVSGQFERMGSFLFGLGVYLSWQYASPRGFGLEGAARTDARLDANRMVRQVLIGLLGIGLILSLLLRSVDLLVQYALLGFTLFYFQNLSAKSLLYWMISLCLLAIGVPSCLGLLHPAGVTPHGLAVWQSVRDWLLADRSVSQGFPNVISYELMMLAGVLVGKLRLLPPDAGLRVRLSLLQVLILPAAFLCKGAWVVMALGLVTLPQGLVVYQPALQSISCFIGPLLLTGVYLLDMGVNARLTPTGPARLLGLVGQMSLTNYVFQSMLCTFLLYGCGLAMPGTLPVWGKIGIISGIYGFQIGFSWLWGNHHRYGPLEWVCRQWLYGKSGQSNSITPINL